MLQSQPLALLYDGTFEGFLSAIFEGMRLKIPVERIECHERYTPQIFETPHSIETHSEHAERVWNGLLRKTHADIAGLFRGAFLSELPGIETALWHYQRKIFQDPTGHVARNILDPHTHLVLATARKVSHEAHLLSGFVRFQNTRHGIQTAVIEPQYNVVSLLAPHFTKRFPHMPWMILDAQRGHAIHYDTHQLNELWCSPESIQRQQGTVVVPHTTPTDPIQDLWKSYYHSINIPERQNVRLMTRLLPKKYWKYLPERQAG